MEQKNEIKESSAPKQLILEHWFQKTWFFLTKVDIGGILTLYLTIKQVKTSTPFQNCS
jgi:hypothetical protein